MGRRLAAVPSAPASVSEVTPVSLLEGKLWTDDGAAEAFRNADQSGRDRAAGSPSSSNTILNQMVVVGRVLCGNARQRFPQAAPATTGRLSDSYYRFARQSGRGFRGEVATKWP
jgi:hypothetical protein